jgi:hypothetical protein
VGAVLLALAVLCTFPARAIEVTLKTDAVLEAPFSTMFKVGPAYLVKDHDYNPAARKIRFSSLWIDIPEQNILHVAVDYCTRDQVVVGSKLTEISLHSDNQTLVRITKVITSESQEDRVVHDESHTNGGLQAIVPGLDCSAGTARFDLAPVQAEIARLPERTLQVQLHFSNRNVQKWQLGAGTVAALKKLPMLGKTASAAP